MWAENQKKTAKEGTECKEETVAVNSAVATVPVDSESPHTPEDQLISKSLTPEELLNLQNPGREISKGHLVNSNTGKNVRKSLMFLTPETQKLGGFIKLGHTPASARSLFWNSSGDHQTAGENKFEKPSFILPPSPPRSSSQGSEKSNYGMEKSKEEFSNKEQTPDDSKETDDSQVVQADPENTEDSSQAQIVSEAVAAVEETDAVLDSEADQIPELNVHPEEFSGYPADVFDDFVVDDTLKEESGIVYPVSHLMGFSRMTLMDKERQDRKSEFAKRTSRAETMQISPDQVIDEVDFGVQRVLEILQENPSIKLPSGLTDDHLPVFQLCSEPAKYPPRTSVNVLTDGAQWRGKVEQLRNRSFAESLLDHIERKRNDVTAEDEPPSRNYLYHVVFPGLIDSRSYLHIPYLESELRFECSPEDTPMKKRMQDGCRTRTRYPPNTRDSRCKAFAERKKVVSSKHFVMVRGKPFFVIQNDSTCQKMELLRLSSAMMPQAVIAHYCDIEGVYRSSDPMQRVGITVKHLPPFENRNLHDMEETDLSGVDFDGVIPDLGARSDLEDDNDYTVDQSEQSESEGSSMRSMQIRRVDEQSPGQAVCFTVDDDGANLEDDNWKDGADDMMGYKRDIEGTVDAVIENVLAVCSGSGKAQTNAIIGTGGVTEKRKQKGKKKKENDSKKKAPTSKRRDPCPAGGDIGQFEKEQVWEGRMGLGDLLQIHSGNALSEHGGVEPGGHGKESHRESAEEAAKRERIQAFIDKKVAPPVDRPSWVPNQLEWEGIKMKLTMLQNMVGELHTHLSGVVESNERIFVTVTQLIGIKTCLAQMSERMALGSKELRRKITKAQNEILSYLSSILGGNVINVFPVSDDPVAFENDDFDQTLKDLEEGKVNQWGDGSFSHLAKQLLSGVNGDGRHSYPFGHYHISTPPRVTSSESDSENVNVPVTVAKGGSRNGGSTKSSTGKGEQGQEQKSATLGDNDDEGSGDDGNGRGGGDDDPPDKRPLKPNLPADKPDAGDENPEEELAEDPGSDSNGDEEKKGEHESESENTLSSGEQKHRKELDDIKQAEEDLDLEILEAQKKKDKKDAEKQKKNKKSDRKKFREQRRKEVEEKRKKLAALTADSESESDSESSLSTKSFQFVNEPEKTPSKQKPKKRKACGAGSNSSSWESSGGEWPRTPTGYAPGSYRGETSAGTPFIYNSSTKMKEPVKKPRSSEPVRKSSASKSLATKASSGRKASETIDLTKKQLEVEKGKKKATPPGGGASGGAASSNYMALLAKSQAKPAKEIQADMKRIGTEYIKRLVRKASYKVGDLYPEPKSVMRAQKTDREELKKAVLDEGELSSVQFEAFMGVPRLTQKQKSGDYWMRFVAGRKPNQAMDYLVVKHPSNEFRAYQGGLDHVSSLGKRLLYFSQVRIDDVIGKWLERGPQGTLDHHLGAMIWMLVKSKLTDSPDSARLIVCKTFKVNMKKAGNLDALIATNPRLFAEAVTIVLCNFYDCVNTDFLEMGDFGATFSKAVVYANRLKCNYRNALRARIGLHPLKKEDLDELESDAPLDEGDDQGSEDDNEPDSGSDTSEAAVPVASSSGKGQKKVDLEKLTPRAKKVAKALELDPAKFSSTEHMEQHITKFLGGGKSAGPGDGSIKQKATVAEKAPHPKFLDKNPSKRLSLMARTTKVMVEAVAKPTPKKPALKRAAPGDGAIKKKKPKKQKEESSSDSSDLT